jgi:DNA-binding response OmpR family regulator
MTEANQGRNRPKSGFSECHSSPAQLEQACLQAERAGQPFVSRGAGARRSKGVLVEQVLLVVEDEADDFVLLNRALRKAGGGAVVSWAKTAAEALALLSQLEVQARVICVVADLGLPAIDGFELLHQIKARPIRACVKFAFLTGRPDRTSEMRALACGADAFFVKPATSEELVAIAEALQRLATVGAEPASPPRDRRVY